MTIEALVISCEHASRRVPSKYADSFRGRAAQAALRDHRGCDIGARAVARALGRALRAPVLETSVTRLLVDCNRSEHHARLFSERSRRLDSRERAELVRRYYRPHRERVERALRGPLDRGRVTLHLGVHSFTPRLGGVTRNADVGLLYDPTRTAERELCLAWQRELAQLDPALRVRRNYPYRGCSDGLTTTMRRELSDLPYLGVELELNQKLLLGSPRRSREVTARVLESLERALARTPLAQAARRTGRPLARSAQDRPRRSSRS